MARRGPGHGKRTIQAQTCLDSEDSNSSRSSQFTDKKIMISRIQLEKSTLTYVNL